MIIPRPRWLGLALISALILTSCAAPTPLPTAEPTATRTAQPTATRPPFAEVTDIPPDVPVSVSIYLGYPPQTLDPGRVTPMDSSAQDLITNLFIGLASLDPDTGIVEPALAESWDRSADGLTWTVSLRDDVSWVRINPDTGEQEVVRLVNAADVLYAVKRACVPEPEAPLVGSVFLIQGCRDVYGLPEQDITDEAISASLGVTVLNDTTIQFKVVKDSALFPALLAMPVMYPVPADLIDSTGGGWAEPSQVWTSGAFALDPSSSAESGYTLTANESWSLERMGNIDIIEASVSDLPSTAFDAWSSGTLAMAAVPPTQLKDTDFGGDQRFWLQALPQAAMLAVSYDTSPMHQTDLRRALALAIDRQGLIDTILEPNGVAGLPAYGIVPPGMAAAPQYGEVGVDFDPEAARQVLRDAGYSNCGGLPQLTLLIDDSPLSEALAAGIVEMWKANLGCGNLQFVVEKLTFQEVLNYLHEPPTAIQRQFRPPRAHAVMLHWQGDYPDAHHWLADLIGCRELFPRAYLDASRDCVGADETLAQAEKNQEIAARRELYAQTEDGYFGPNGEMPVMPLFFYARALAFQSWLEFYPVYAGPLRFDRWIVHEADQP